MSVLQFYMLQELAKELNGAGFPNIQDVQRRQGREFLTPDGRVSVYSLGEAAPTEDWFLPTLSELITAWGIAESVGSAAEATGRTFSSGFFGTNRWGCAISAGAAGSRVTITRAPTLVVPHSRMEKSCGRRIQPCEAG